MTQGPFCLKPNTPVNIAGQSQFVQPIPLSLTLSTEELTASATSIAASSAEPMATNMRKKNAKSKFLPFLSALKNRVSWRLGMSAQETLSELCAEAFRRFGTIALWNLKKPDGVPTPAQATAVALALRANCGMDGFALAKKIQDTADAA